MPPHSLMPGGRTLEFPRNGNKTYTGVAIMHRELPDTLVGQDSMPIHRINLLHQLGRFKLVAILKAKFYHALYPILLVKEILLVQT